MNLLEILSSMQGAAKDPQFRSDVTNGVLDVLNRGLVAQTVGAPVDVANIAMNALKAGYGYAGHKTGLLRTDQMPNLEEMPVGGSEWIGEQMRKMGSVSANRNPVGEMIAGGMLAPAAGAQLSAKTPQIANVLNRIGENAAAPRTLRPETGAVVYHGSPHKFDKFDSSKIGTGEGAQAYGHGLYFAESPAVGNDYAQVLASPRNRVMDKQGVYIEPSPMDDGTYRLARASEWGRMKGQVGDGTQGLTDYQYPSLAAAIRAARKQGYLSRDRRPMLNAIGEDGKYVPVSKAADTEEVLGYEPKYAQFVASEPGNLYKVDLPDEHIAKMLDWDKPLSEQPAVLNAVQRAGYKPSPDMSAGEFIKSKSAEGFSQYLADDLKKQGIPGIRYLDGGSRGTGTGTSNFVVFPGNEGLLKILERNGQPLP